MKNLLFLLLFFATQLNGMDAIIRGITKINTVETNDRVMYTAFIGLTNKRYQILKYKDTNEINCQMIERKFNQKGDLFYEKTPLNNTDLDLTNFFTLIEEQYKNHRIM